LKRIKTLVVDDSQFMRVILTKLLEKEGISVIGTAKNGKEAVEKTKDLSPDVILMDINMPVMDGLEAIKRIMYEKPTPIVVLSGVTKNDRDKGKRAIEYGAIDIIDKPSGELSIDISTKIPEIVSKIKIASSSTIKGSKPKEIYAKRKNLIRKAVVIGASTGGPSAVEFVLSKFPSDTALSFLVVQHMPQGFTKRFAERLNERCDIEVVEAYNDMEISEGVAIVAPGDYHMEVVDKKKPKVKLNKNEKIHGVRPSIDVTMLSAAKIFGKKLIGVLLTGMGSDGVLGISKIKEMGGFTIAQDEATSQIFGMPKKAIESGNVDKILPIYAIPYEIMKRSME